ncbi:MAG: tetratricopeptide repeat protein [Bacteroidota bacterium]
MLVCFLVFSNNILGQSSQANQNHILQQIDSLNDCAYFQKGTDAVKAYQCAQAAYRLALSHEYLKGQAYGLTEISRYHKNKRQFEQAIDTMSRSMAIRLTMGNPSIIASGYTNMGLIHAAKGDYERALLSYDNSLQYANKLAKVPQRTLAMTYNNIGNAHKRLQRYDDAIRYYDKSLDIHLARGDTVNMASSNMSKATLYQEIGKVDRAMEIYKQCLSIFRQNNKHKNTADVLFNLGGIELHKGNPDAALNYLEQCYQLYQQHHFEHQLHGLYNNLGLLYRLKKDHAKAKIYLEESLEHSRKTGAHLQEVETMVNLAMIDQDQGKKEAARQKYEVSLKKAQELAPFTAMNINQRLGQLAASQQNYTEAYRFQKSSDSIQNNYVASLININRLEEQLAQQKIQEQALANAQLSSHNKSLLIGGLIALICGLVAFFWIHRRNQMLQYQKEIAQRDKAIAEQEVLSRQERVEILLKEKEVEALSSMIEGEENERERIARDLHDRLGSLLSVTIMQFRTIVDYLPESFDQEETVGRVNSLLEETCEEVRRIAQNMSSGFLTKFGLKPALNKLVNTINDTDQIKANLILHGLDDRLKPNFEIDVYRVVQELTSNALRHAQAEELELQLIKNDQILNIMIEDNGCGFDKGQLLELEGMGLKNVEARIKRLNGQYNIDSVQGRGTIVSIDIPV